MESVESQKSRIHKLLNAKFRKAKSIDDDLEEHLEARLCQDTFVESPLFRHTALPTPSHTRLLTIHPGIGHQELQCSLRHADLATLKETKFTALSYVWGDQGYLIPARCNDMVALIGMNLYSAMLRARHSELEMLFWIDALCVSQGKDPAALEERAFQVRIMDKIYSAASMVLVDLGGCNRQEVNKLFILFKDFGHIVFTERPTAAEYALISRCFRDELLRTSLERLSKSPWFSRIWVMQEFTLAAEVVMMLGRLCVTPAWLRILFARIKLSMSLNPSDTGEMSSDRQRDCLLDMSRFDTSFQLMYVMRELSLRRACHRSTDNAHTLSFSDVLDLTRSKEATDTRDHVYAIMGIIPGLDLTRFAIDYAEDEAALAVRFARTLVGHGFGAYCLSRASGINSKLPSWAPWLTTAFMSTSLVETSSKLAVPGFINDDDYNVCGHTKLELDVNCETGTLKARARLIDTVKSFSRPYTRVTHKSSLTQKATSVVSYQRSYRWALNTFTEWSETHLRCSIGRTLLLDDSLEFKTKEFGRQKVTAKEFEAFHQFFSGKQRPSDIDPAVDPADVKGQQNATAARFLIFIWLKSGGRKLCRTQKGRMALISEESTHDDEIWIVLGYRAPLVLRRMNGYHLLVGACYVDGIMDGEIMQLPESEREVETIYLR